MRKILISLLLFALPVMSSAQVYETRGDIQYPKMGLTDLEIMEGSYVPLSAVLLQDGDAYTNIANYSAKFRYAKTAESTNGFITATNTTVTTETGSFLIPLDASHTSTNGLFWFTVEWLDASGNSFFSGTGTLDVIETTVTGNPTALNTERPINWDGATYINPQDAPMIVGDGVVGTTNANGQVTISVTVAATGVTNITAGTNIVITGTSANPTISTDGSLQNAIDANSATGALNTAAISANDTDISNLASTQQTVKATADSAMQDLVDDTTPTLGGNLDGNNKSISDVITYEATLAFLAPSFRVNTGGIGYAFQSDNNSDVGTVAESARTVHSHTNFFKGHGGSSNITMKSNIFGVTNAISFTIGGDTYSILFD